MNDIITANQTNNCKEHNFSKDACHQLNKNFGSWIRAIALNHNSKKNASSFKVEIQNPKITSISQSDCKLSYICCNGEICSIESLTIEFVPRLITVEDARNRLKEEYVHACMPKCYWLVSDPLGLLIIVAFLTLSYLHCYYFSGNDGIAKSSMLLDVITFRYAVKASFYFCIVAHIAEAIYVAYLSHATLKLPLYITVKWFILVCCVGYPITIQFMNLITPEVKNDGSNSNEEQKCQ